MALEFECATSFKFMKYNSFHELSTQLISALEVLLCCFLPSWSVTKYF
jgi:hypothetical protein